MKKKIYCPVHDYGCVYFDNGACTIEDPYVDCDEFMGYLDDEYDEDDEEDEEDEDE